MGSNLNRMRICVERTLMCGTMVAAMVSMAMADQSDSSTAAKPKSPAGIRAASTLPTRTSRGQSFFATASDTTEPKQVATPPAATKITPFNGRTLLTRQAPAKSSGATGQSKLGTTTSTGTSTTQTTTTGTSSTQSTSSGTSTQSAPTTTQTAAAQPTADYRGVPFVTTPAPNLKFERRSTPHLTGIDYDFQEQTAQGVCLFSRFPTFTLSDRRVHLGGPWYDNDAANGQLTHGVTSMEAMPAYRNESSPTNMRTKLAWDKKGELFTDGGGPLYDRANQLINDLVAVNPNDARLPALRRLVNDGVDWLGNIQHTMVSDQAAYLALGHKIWQTQAGALDSAGHYCKYPMLDVELTGGTENQRNCLGWIYQGMAAESAAVGCLLTPITYGQWTFDPQLYWFCYIDTATGWPLYLSPSRDFAKTNDPTIQACNDGGGALSKDGYLRAIWGKEPFYKRNANGSLILSNGQPIFNDITSTTCYGATLPLNTDEADKCLRDLYCNAAQMHQMHYCFAGQYPASSDLRKSFLNNTKIGAWSRYTNEGMDGMLQNDRPIPGWEMEMLMGMYLFTADDIVTWTSDMWVVGPLGNNGLNSNGTSVWKYNAHGVAEFVIKAMHRYSVLDPLHQGTFKWCWFHLPMTQTDNSVPPNCADGERYYQKPIVFGKIRTYNGQPWFELFAAWPALDNQSTDMKLWIDKDGARSPTYTIRLVNGRSYFYDGWQLPVGFSGLEGKHVKLQFKDQMGVTRTWCGDYRVAP